MPRMSGRVKRSDKKPKCVKNMIAIINAFIKMHKPFILRLL